MNNYLLQLIQIRVMLNHHPLFAVGLLLLVGYFIGKIASKIKLPEITGYIIAGLIMGKSITGIVTHTMGESLQVITEVALGLIALTIGSEFSWFKLKRTGREVIIITLIQLFATFLSVTVALFLFKMPLPFALLLGAIASATAPAATVAIVHSLRAHGLFIDYLYGIVALDDAGSVILFGIIFSISSSFLHVAGEAHNMMLMILHAVGEVFLSIVLGLISGFFLHFFTRKKSNNNEILILSLGIILFTTALSIVLHLSPLLTNMATGAILINLSARNHRIFRIIEPVTPPLYALFFIIAGTELKLDVIFNTGTLIFGLVYILSRAIGKYSGVYIGCHISKTSNKIKKYLGVCMFPQAGVAIGLVLLIQTSPVFNKIAMNNELHASLISNLINIVLLSVLVNELLGPPLSKYAIIKGNEMEEK